MFQSQKISLHVFSRFTFVFLVFIALITFSQQTQNSYHKVKQQEEKLRLNTNTNKTCILSQNLKNTIAPAPVVVFNSQLTSYQHILISKNNQINIQAIRLQKFQTNEIKINPSPILYLLRIHPTEEDPNLV